MSAALWVGASDQEGLPGGFVTEVGLSFRSGEHAQPGCDHPPGESPTECLWLVSGRPELYASARCTRSPSAAWKATRR